MEGTIIVDGVLASCHASCDHSLAHFVTTPIQWFPDKIEQIYGEENGCQLFARVVEELGQWMSPHDMLYYLK